ncbi:glycolate oxidase subunit GlcF [Microvirga splendida]|uniref:Glycolate oxidase iron-sulfur subunit n=1 Tax=Microvirga splendida TaxID=2795727 RepID=A0ABS0XXS5_9HYPH|nr:glycolate oxidase subunit GlcF [Microvirga splendida]MBJ6124846.1 glycolate oxidase subunit GlcF [Microvirga splendida]
MRTNFSEAQLADPEIAEANQILETCVHYGFCTNTCPTYVLTRDENDSPRGRIDLIRRMLEKGGPPDPKTVHHLDRCLSCLSCMTTCAVKVDYVHLIDRARVHIEHHHRRPWPERFLRGLLANVLPYPRRFQWALRGARAAKVLPSMVPSALRASLAMVPEPKRLDTDILAPGVYPAEGQRRKRVAVLAGCAQQVLNGNINRAAIRLLRRHGCDVIVSAGVGCCGSLTLHMGRESDARVSARAAIAAWTREIEAEGLDAIVVNASGCGTTVKDYGHLFARDPGMAEPARCVAALARDVSEILVDLGLAPPAEPKAYRVAYHDPCSMQHGQRVTRHPRELLRAAGFQVMDIPEKHFCCGSAGTYNLLQPDMAERLGQRKADHVASTDPDIVATGNIGCMMQIGQYLGRPVLHTVELLDWATGGPCPPALAGVPLREPAEPNQEPAPDIPVVNDGGGAANDVGVW